MKTPVWLLKVWHVLQAVAKWLKGNWLLLLLGAVLVYTFVVARGNSKQYGDLLKQFQDQMTRNRQELDQLRQIQQNQIAQQQLIDQKYQEVVQKIEHDYQSQLHQLDAQKEQELRAIIAANHDDPAVMAREINTLFGIPIYTVPNP